MWITFLDAVLKLKQHTLYIVVYFIVLLCIAALSPSWLGPRRSFTATPHTARGCRAIAIGTVRDTTFYETTCTGGAIPLDTVVITK